MPKNKGSRGGSFRGRGRGGSRGGRGGGRGGRNNKHHGRGGGGGGGGGGGRKLYPTSQGFVYKVQSEYYDPETSEDDLEDDFPLFGQFGAVDDPNFDPDIEVLKAKEAKATKQRKVLDHRALLESRQRHHQRNGDSETGMIRSSRNNDKVQIRNKTYTKAVTFTRSSTLLNDDNNQNNHEKEEISVEPEITTTTAEERIVIEEADESSGFYFDSNPNDSVIHEIDDNEIQHDNDDHDDNNDDETPGLGFYFDSNPGPVSFNTSSSNDNNYHHQQPSSRSNNNHKKDKGKQRQQKRKIIKGDDIYLGSSSSEEEDNNIRQKPHHQKDVIRLDDNSNDRDYDDDIEIMRDYIENVRLDDEEEMEALRAFANGADISAQNYPEVVVVVSSDSDEEDDGSEEDYSDDDDDDDDDDMQVSTSNDQVDDDFDTIENGGFDHLSDDESIEEISEQDFRYALEQSIDHVPPSLQTGIRNRITRETKREKKLAKKQKRLDQRSSKQAKREHEGNNVQLRKLDKRIRMFIMDDQLSSYQLAPMSKFCRRQLHLLATAYKLKSYSFGTGAQRTPVLQKTGDTFLPNDRRYIERFLDEAQNTIDAQSSILRKHRMTSPLPNFNKPNKKGKHGGKKEKKDKKKKEKPMSNPVENTVVGGNSAPINESNVGHRMLAAMGWKQGDALGANNDGITAPIEAIVRKKRQGLGS